MVDDGEAVARRMKQTEMMRCEALRTRSGFTLPLLLPSWSQLIGFEQV